MCCLSAKKKKKINRQKKIKIKTSRKKKKQITKTGRLAMLLYLADAKPKASRRVQRTLKTVRCPDFDFGFGFPKQIPKIFNKKKRALALSVCLSIFVHRNKLHNIIFNFKARFYSMHIRSKLNNHLLLSHPEEWVPKKTRIFSLRARGNRQYNCWYRLIYLCVRGGAARVARGFLIHLRNRILKIQL